MKKDRAAKIIVASWIGIVVNAAIAALKIVAGILTGSIAVVSDGVDSASDIATSIVTLTAAHISRRPPTPKFPFGFSRIETVSTKFLAFVIFFAGLQLVIAAVTRLIAGGSLDVPGIAAIYVTIVSILVKTALAVYKIGLGRRIKSSMLVANGRNMQSDVIVSVGVLIGLIAMRIFVLRWIDAVAALFVGIWILKTAFQIFRETDTELMDGLTDTHVYNRVFEAVASVDGATNPHRVRIRNIGHLHVIMLDIEVAPDLTVREAHGIAHRVEDRIRTGVEDVHEVIVHTEPLGERGLSEGFGVKESDVGTPNPSGES